MVPFRCGLHASVSSIYDTSSTVCDTLGTHLNLKPRCCLPFCFRRLSIEPLPPPPRLGWRKKRKGKWFTLQEPLWTCGKWNARAYKNLQEKWEVVVVDVNLWLRCDWLPYRCIAKKAAHTHREMEIYARTHQKGIQINKKTKAKELQKRMLQGCGIYCLKKKKARSLNWWKFFGCDFFVIWLVNSFVTGLRVISRFDQSKWCI